MVYQPIKIWGEKEDNGSPVNLEGDIQYCSKFKDTGNLCGTTGMVYGLRLNFFFPSDIFFIYNLSITVRKKKGISVDLILP
jgi:hypothetical protein